MGGGTPPIPPVEKTLLPTSPPPPPPPPPKKKKRWKFKVPQGPIKLSNSIFLGGGGVIPCHIRSEYICGHTYYHVQSTNWTNTYVEDHTCVLPCSVHVSSEYRCGRSQFINWTYTYVEGHTQILLCPIHKSSKDIHMWTIIHVYSSSTGIYWPHSTLYFLYFTWLWQ